MQSAISVTTPSLPHAHTTPRTSTSAGHRRSAMRTRGMAWRSSASLSPRRRRAAVTCSRYMQLSHGDTRRDDGGCSSLLP